MNLAMAFASSAESNADKTAVYWGDEAFSYRVLLSQTHALAWHLQNSLNVGPGDRVALWLKNCPEFVPSLFAILESGAVVVPINNFLKADEAAYILKDAGARTVICDAHSAETMEPLRRRIDGLNVWDIEALSSLPNPPESEEARIMGHGRAEQDLAVIIYTSGTTGRPKGAMLSHGNLLHNVESCRQVLSAVDADRFVVLLPMFHSFMLCVCVFLPLLVGGSMVIIRSLHPPKNILHEIIQHQATILPSIPQFFRTLANATLPGDLPLRACVSGGAPLPVEILREFKAKMTIPLIEGYGLSEASPVVSMNPMNGLAKEGSIGMPIPEVEITIQSETGDMLPVGDVGELCVRGGNVMLGYWNQPTETAKVLHNHWLRTGDIGYQDEDGYFFITDRKKDMLLVNGVNVYPREIEEVIYQYPGVKEAAVVGIKDLRKGEQPVAFLVANEGERIDEPTLLKFIRQRLADYKVPRRVRLLDALPKNATGKVLKTVLRDQAG